MSRRGSSYRGSRPGSLRVKHGRATFRPAIQGKCRGTRRSDNGQVLPVREPHLPRPWAGSHVGLGLVDAVAVSTTVNIGEAVRLLNIEPGLHRPFHSSRGPYQWPQDIELPPWASQGSLLIAVISAPGRFLSSSLLLAQRQVTPRCVGLD
jgi:hypothetical protein